MMEAIGSGYKNVVCTALVATLAGGCCSSYEPVNKEMVKHLYARDKLFNYPAELDCGCKERSEEGDILGDFFTRIRWGFAVVNDTFIELPFSAALGLLGGEDGVKAGQYFADKLPGGRLPNDVSDMIIKGDIDGAMQRIYDGEDTELGGHVALFLVGGSHYLMIDDAQREVFGGSKSTLDRALNKIFGSDIISDGGDGKGGAATPAETFKPGPAPEPPFGP